MGHDVVHLCLFTCCSIDDVPVGVDCQVVRKSKALDTRVFKFPNVQKLAYHLSKHNGVQDA